MCGREVWCVGGRCGVWEAGVMCGKEVWYLEGRWDVMEVGVLW